MSVPLSDHAITHLRRVAEWPEPAGDRYEVIGPIGSGGMGTVYRAADHLLGREVALKVLRADLSEAGWAERLQREARILARLEHPGIVPVHDVERLADGRVCYVMKLIRGVRFDEFAHGATLSEVLRAFLRVTDTVSFAHAQGVVHRDLKPSNIMVAAFGEVLVLDWGIARLTGSGAEAPPECAMPTAPGDTAPGSVLGTPGFMAPEQAQGESHRADERTDVYALGAILREVVMARHPATEVPRPLAAIWDRARSPDPAGRYPTAAEMAEEVTRFLEGLPVLAYREPWGERVGRVYRRYQTPILLVLAYLTMRLLFLALRGI
jgi:serine/threonine protein kinase